MKLKILMQVYSHHSCEKSLMERGFVKAGKGLIQMRHRSNYDGVLFLTSTNGLCRGSNPWLMKQTLQPLDHVCSSIT